MTTYDLETALNTARLDDQTDRLMLADLLAEHGRDKEAELCRAGMALPLQIIHGGYPGYTRVGINIWCIDKFTESYIDTAITLELDSETGRPLDRKHDWSDIEPASLARMIQDCAEFQSTNEGDLIAFEYDATAGYLFWLNRNGHGHGFWSYDGEHCERLHRASKARGKCSLYKGDDGRIYYHCTGG